MYEHRLHRVGGTVVVSTAARRRRVHAARRRVAELRARLAADGPQAGHTHGSGIDHTDRSE